MNRIEVHRLDADRCKSPMQPPQSNIVADGGRRLRDAGDYWSERRRILAGLMRDCAEAWRYAAWWDRILIYIRIRRAAAAMLRKRFPRGALHVVSNVIAGSVQSEVERFHPKLPPRVPPGLPRRVEVNARHLSTGALLFIIALAMAGPSVLEASVPVASADRVVRVAAISFVPSKLDLQGNAGRLEAAFRKAAAGGAQLAVAPEGALDGYVINEVLARKIPLARLSEVAIGIGHPVIGKFRALAKELRLSLVFGFAERIGADVFNTAVFVDADGAIRGKYHKMQFAEGYHPTWWFNRLGTSSRAFDTPFGRCGILICNDRWNPSLARIAALDGAQFLVIPAYGSTSRSQDAAVLDRARETGLPIVEANVGVSLIVSDGEIVAVEREKETIAFGEIVIPAAVLSQPDERDVVEREFLAWRADEMRRRYEAKKHELVPSALKSD